MTPRQFFAAVRGMHAEREWNLWIAAQNAGWIMGPWTGKTIKGTDLVNVSIFKNDDPPVKSSDEVKPYLEDLQREAAMLRNKAREKAGLPPEDVT